MILVAAHLNPKETRLEIEREGGGMHHHVMSIRVEECLAFVEHALGNSSFLNAYLNLN
jgi:hypothetical protein